MMVSIFKWCYHVVMKFNVGPQAAFILIFVQRVCLIFNLSSSLSFCSIHFHKCCLTSTFYSCFCVFAGWQDKGWRQNCSSGWWIYGRTVSGQGKNTKTHTQYSLQGHADLIIYDLLVFFVFRCPVWFSNIKSLSNSPSAVPRVSPPRLPLYLFPHLSPILALSLMFPLEPSLSPPPPHRWIPYRPLPRDGLIGWDPHPQFLTMWTAQLWLARKLP